MPLSTGPASDPHAPAPPNPEPLLDVVLPAADELDVGLALPTEPPNPELPVADALDGWLANPPAPPNPELPVAGALDTLLAPAPPEPETLPVVVPLDRRGGTVVHASSAAGRSMASISAIKRIGRMSRGTLRIRTTLAELPLLHTPRTSARPGARPPASWDGPSRSR